MIIRTSVAILLACGAVAFGYFLFKQPQEISTSAPVTPTAEDRDCPEFETQPAAQEYFTSHGGSTTNNFDRLDKDGDGIACEDNPTRNILNL